MRKAMVKAVVGSAAKSSTVWLGVAWTVLATTPELLNSVVSGVGPFSPELATKVVAASLVATRLRSIIKPIVAAAKAAEPPASPS